jgi:hypothetical protein
MIVDYYSVGLPFLGFRQNLIHGGSGSIELHAVLINIRSFHMEYRISLVQNLTYITLEISRYTFPETPRMYFIDY